MDSTNTESRATAYQFGESIRPCGSGSRHTQQKALPVVRQPARMNRRSVLALCGAGLGSFTGCLDRISDNGRSRDTSPRTETTEAASRETTDGVDHDGERNASPNEFVYVERVENPSTVETAPANETAAFRNLSEQRRQTFRAALEQETVAADGWSYYNDSRPRYVRYNGTWFRVIVGVH